MPKKKRQAHIPQGSPRKRRPIRRNGLDPAGNEQTNDLDGQPIFAEEVAVGVPGVTPSGPVETRPHRVASSSAPQGSATRRRMEQLRRNREDAPVRVVAGQLPSFAPGYLSNELRRITITSVSLFAVIIVLAIILR
jgi:hypothetical protein